MTEDSEAHRVDLRRAWQGLGPTGHVDGLPAEELAASDERTRFAVAHLQAAWGALESPTATLPAALQKRLERRVVFELTARRSAVRLAVAGIVAALLWSRLHLIRSLPGEAQSEAPRAASAAPRSALPPATVASYPHIHPEHVHLRPDGVEFEAEGIRFVLLEPR